MEAGAVVKAGPGQFLEILNGLGRGIGPELDDHGAFGRLDDRDFVGGGFCFGGLIFGRIVGLGPVQAKGEEGHGGRERESKARKRAVLQIFHIVISWAEPGGD